jgi:hypothetical protein
MKKRYSCYVIHDGFLLGLFFHREDGQQSSACYLLLVGFITGLFFYSEDVGDIFLRNAG